MITATRVSAVLLAATTAIAMLAAPGLARDKGKYETVRLTATFKSPFGAVPREALSDAQRRELRAYGRDMCRERLKYEGPGYIRNIAILSDGRVRCYFAS